MIDKNITPYQDVNEVISVVSEGVVSIFGDKLVGIYLFGSLSYGDFNPDSSDIDFVSIVKEKVTQEELTKLKKMHIELEKLFPKWADRLESSYTPQYLLTEVLPPKEPRPYYGAQTFYDEAPYGNEWIINNYLLYNHGIRILGSDFKELVKPINMRDVQEASAKDLFKEWEPKLRETEWLEDSHNQCYLVLNLCRILNTVINAQVLSKKKSAAWVKQAYPHWQELIEKAESWKYGVDMGRNEETLQFLQFVIETVDQTQNEQ